MAEKPRLFPPCVNPANRTLKRCKGDCPLRLVSQRVAAPNAMNLTEGRAAFTEQDIESGRQSGYAVLGEVQVRAIQVSGRNVHGLERICARYRGKYPIR